MLFPRALVALSVAALASAQSNPSPSQESALSADLVSFFASVTADPAFASNNALATSAVPALTDANAPGLTATPTWFTALPTGVQNYYSSIIGGAVSVVSKDLKGPAPTNAPAPAAMMAAGVGAAAGLVALAL